MKRSKFADLEQMCDQERHLKQCIHRCKVAKMIEDRRQQQLANVEVEEEEETKEDFRKMMAKFAKNARLEQMGDKKRHWTQCIHRCKVAKLIEERRQQQLANVEVEEETEEDLIKKMMAKCAEDDRLEQMGDQRRRLKKCIHRREVAKLIEDRRQQQLANVEVEEETEEDFRKMMMAKLAKDDRLEQMGDQRRRLKKCIHRLEVEKLIEDRRKQQLANVEVEEDTEEDFRKKMMAKLAKEDRLEQMGDHKKRLKKCIHRREVAKLIEDRRQQQLANVEVKEETEEDFRKKMMAKFAEDDWLEQMGYQRRRLKQCIHRC
ncbi:meiosis-specific nuclear structural protein 1-like isoform X2 [Paralichthys olivaceus]|uniref:meiosis-specific nuclear structural protein 1-like isoform X2 n=1 Tax=Paralichthys olivaceus TaxID=8255 RepID=UPI003751254F